MGRRLLCQSCLSFDNYTDKEVEEYFKDHEGSCHNCGGELCHCDGCNNTGILLMEGEIDPDVLQLRPNVIIENWTPEKGCE